MEGEDGLGERGGEGGQEFDGLGDEAVGGGGADAETGRELHVRVAVSEVGESEQGLSARAQAPPSGPRSAAVFSQAGGEEAQGGTGTSPRTSAVCSHRPALSGMPLDHPLRGRGIRGRRQTARGRVSLRGG